MRWLHRYDMLIYYMPELVNDNEHAAMGKQHTCGGGGRAWSSQAFLFCSVKHTHT